MWLYPRIIVSKSRENTSKYVDTVNLFAKTWTKGHWPLDDLWPHICWGHMCDSTQGSFCPSPMGIHQCMRIQWSILQKLPHTYTYYIHILHTHTTYRISDHIVSFWTTFRRDKKSLISPTSKTHNTVLLGQFYQSIWLYFIYRDWCYRAWEFSGFCLNLGFLLPKSMQFYFPCWRSSEMGLKENWHCLCVWVYVWME